MGDAENKIEMLRVLVIGKSFVTERMVRMSSDFFALHKKAYPLQTEFFLADKNNEQPATIVFHENRVQPIGYIHRIEQGLTVIKIGVDEQTGEAIYGHIGDSKIDQLYMKIDFAQSNNEQPDVAKSKSYSGLIEALKKYWIFILIGGIFAYSYISSKGGLF